jgi:hypothetical protein
MIKLLFNNQAKQLIENSERQIISIKLREGEKKN